VVPVAAMKKREWRNRALEAERALAIPTKAPTFHTVTLITGMDPNEIRYLTCPATDYDHKIDLPAMGFRLERR
jgi:hypothetical protein